MPRISGIPTKDASPLLRLIYWFTRRRYGAVPEPATVTAHHMKLLMASGRHELAVQKASKALPANVRELAVYRVAQQLGCSWCVDFGTMLQRHAGLDIERLQQIDKYATSPAYSEQERLAIAYADAMSTSPVSEVAGEFATLRQNSYTAFRRRLGPDNHHLPAHLSDVVTDVIRFVDPLTDPEKSTTTWNPALREWQ